MTTSSIVPSLFLFTLIGVFVIALVGYLLFLRKRGNRHPVEKPSQAGKTMAPTHPEQAAAGLGLGLTDGKAKDRYLGRGDLGRPQDFRKACRHRHLLGSLIGVSDHAPAYRAADLPAP